MKKIIVILVFSIFSVAISKEIEIPKVVEDTFTQKFMNASSLKWEKEGKDYEVNFKMSNQKMSAKFSADGDWDETEILINSSKLNKKILDYLNSKYPKYKIIEAVSVESKKDGEFLEVEFKFNGKKIELKFTFEGNLIEKK